MGCRYGFVKTGRMSPNYKSINGVQDILRPVTNRYMTAWRSSKTAVDASRGECYNPCMFLGPAEPSAQVERILRSETLRASGVLQRLLRYLADKAFSGEADQLKEYTIGIDAFGKPPSYDPRQDAIVRLQVGRLRQKLGEYYRTEGKDDPVVLDLPKGRFKLKWEVRPAETETAVSRVIAVQQHKPEATHLWRRVALALGFASLILASWSAYSATQLWRIRHSSPGSPAWTSDLEQLWRPFLVSNRPLIVAIADPLFIGLQGTDVYFRKISLRRPEDAARSPEVSALQKLLGNPSIQPTFNFTPTGEMISSFLVAKLLGTRRQDISLARSSQVPLQELAANNVILIGPEVVFNQKLPGMQFEPALDQVPAGIRNLQPRSGEPSLFADKPAGAEPNDGEVYALISHAPGPLGNTNIQSFTSNRTWGRAGAIQAFTDPLLARTLVNKLRRPSGEIPRYYQVVLRVKFRDGVPTDIAYVLHRDLTPL